LRTFDIGGDKFSSVFQMPAEMNPALGLRAVRLGLARQDRLPHATAGHGSGVGARPNALMCR